MPTLMVTETTETTYFDDGSFEEESYQETETFKNSKAFESESETITYYTDDQEMADEIMGEAEFDRCLEVV